MSSQENSLPKDNTFSFRPNRRADNFPTINLLEFSRMGNSASQPIKCMELIKVDKQAANRKISRPLEIGSAISNIFDWLSEEFFTDILSYTCMCSGEACWGSDFTHQSMPLPEGYPAQFLRPSRDIKNYNKNQLYFLKNPRVMYNPVFYYEGLSIDDAPRLNFRDEGLSIGVFQSVFQTDACPNNVISMYIARSRPLKTKHLDVHHRTYDSEEKSRISYFCRQVFSLNLVNLRILVLYQILLDDSVLQKIGCLKLELLHLISCWWDLKRVGYDAPLKASFKRLHITQYDNAFVTYGWLLHKKLEELVINSHVPSPEPFFLWATECNRLERM
jgi:hypothetical protein